ncbi:MAG: M20/M25/M40 family metallo-hydrolase [Ruminococcus sp.]|nr:M20/M25/M40 family metallo-hydrolase [Ruminococcus sp.]
MKNKIKENLKILSELDFEYAKIEALKMLKQHFADAKINKGNIIAGNGPLLVDAHIDQVGFMVTYITDEGYLKIGAMAGIDAKIMPGQILKIYGNEPRIGAIISTPPHLTDSDEKEKVSKISDLLIDCGFEDITDAKQFVSRGDYVAWDGAFTELTDDKVIGKSFDNRAGVVAILYALSLLSEEDKNKLTIVFSDNEEIGERGAKIAAFGSNCEAALAVDVSFGYTEGLDKAKCGIMGKGPMIGISPSLSRTISAELLEVAETKKIPYQSEVMPTLTGTNADQFSVSKTGLETCTVSIPLKNMHSPIEIISISDILYTGNLLFEYIKKY